MAQDHESNHESPMWSKEDLDDPSGKGKKKTLKGTWGFIPLSKWVKNRQVDSQNIPTYMMGLQ